MTPADAVVPDPVVPTPPPQTNRRSAWAVVWETLLVIMGVGLPVIALLTEIFTRICGEAFIDPVPTPFHVPMVALAPAANLLVWLGLRRGWNLRGKWPGLLNGAALAVSLSYAVVFLPLTPFALLALFAGWWYMGVGLLGLLPLAPALSFVAALVLRRRLVRARAPAGGRGLPGLRPGFLAALALLLAACAPEVITLCGLRWATSKNPETRDRGIATLRRFGREEMVLRFCHGGNSVYDAILNEWILRGESMDSTAARVIYYRLTGRDARHVRRPGGGLAGLLGRGRFREEELVWDTQQGGTTVGGILKDLFLDSSRMDGTLDGDAGLGYMEWTLVFRNEARFNQREARATVALPAGAVVSRLTLWVNGEEREAAFGGRSQVREAYEKVVRARRDPVLVTTCGPDRILIQCFPVEPNGGGMKLRLGMTVPLQPAATPGAWILNLPVFLERNFKFSPGKSHDIWMESRGVIGLHPDAKETTLACSADSEGVWSLRGRLEDGRLWEADARMSVQGQGDGVAWCEDTISQPGVVRQVLAEAPGEKPASVVLVMDGSGAMQRHAAGVARALRESFPENIRLGAIVVGDETPKMPALEAGSAGKAADAIGNFPYEGGRCSVRALETGWDALAAESGAAIMLWIHGSQPVPMDSAEGLLQRMERQPGRVLLISLQTEPGTDLVSAELEKAVGVTMLPPSRDTAMSLGGLFQTWAPEAGIYKAVRTREAATPGQEAGVKTSEHLARLWAHEEAMRMLATGKPPDALAASELALRYHLVTPVSGAVVLETAQQFKDAGLEPVPADTVPTIPEPEFWAIAIVALLAAWFLLRRRRTQALS